MQLSNVTNSKLRASGNYSAPLFDKEGLGEILLDKSALCEIQWVIKFHFSTKKINHVDKVMDIAVTPGASFG